MYVIDYLKVFGASLISLTDDCISSFNTIVLVAHNNYRANHGVDGLEADDKIIAIAQKYSDYLAVNDIFKHSGAEGLGENLAAIFYSTLPNVNPDDCAGKNKAFI